MAALSAGLAAPAARRPCAEDRFRVRCGSVCRGDKDIRRHEPPARRAHRRGQETFGVAHRSSLAVLRAGVRSRAHGRRTRLPAMERDGRLAPLRLARLESGRARGGRSRRCSRRNRRGEPRPGHRRRRRAGEVRARVPCRRGDACPVRGFARGGGAALCVASARDEDRGFARRMPRGVVCPYDGFRPPDRPRLARQLQVSRHSGGRAGDRACGCPRSARGPGGDRGGRHRLHAEGGDMERPCARGVQATAVCRRQGAEGPGGNREVPPQGRRVQVSPRRADGRGVPFVWRRARRIRRGRAGRRVLLCGVRAAPRRAAEDRLRDEEGRRRRFRGDARDRVRRG